MRRTAVVVRREVDHRLGRRPRRQSGSAPLAAARSAAWSDTGPGGIRPLFLDVAEQCQLRCHSTTAQVVGERLLPHPHSIGPVVERNHPAGRRRQRIGCSTRHPQHQPPAARGRSRDGPGEPAPGSDGGSARTRASPTDSRRQTRGQEADRRPLSRRPTLARSEGGVHATSRPTGPPAPPLATRRPPRRPRPYRSTRLRWSAPQVVADSGPRRLDGTQPWSGSRLNSWLPTASSRNRST